VLVFSFLQTICQTCEKGGSTEIVVLQKHKAHMEEYKRTKSDEAYHQDMFDLMKRMIDNPQFLER